MCVCVCVSMCVCMCTVIISINKNPIPFFVEKYNFSTFFNASYNVLITLYLFLLNIFYLNFYKILLKFYALFERKNHMLLQNFNL